MATTALIDTKEVIVNGTRFGVLGGVKPSATDQMVQTLTIGDGDSTREEKASKWFISTTAGGFGRHKLRPGSGVTPDKFWDADVRTDGDEITLLPEPIQGFNIGALTADIIDWGSAVYFVAGTRLIRYNVPTATYQEYCTTHLAWETAGTAHAAYALPGAGVSFDNFNATLLIWCGASGLVKYDDAAVTFTTAAGVPGMYSCAFDGRCVKVKADGTVEHSTDLTTWTTAGRTNNEAPTSMTVYMDGQGDPQIYVGTVKGPWTVDVYQNRVRPTYVRFSDRQADNCRAMAPWNAELMIAKGASLRRFSHGQIDQMSEVGPSLSDGLPLEKVGRIVDLEATMEHMLIAALDGGTDAVSTLMYWRGTSWHPLVDGDVVGERIRAVAFSSQTAVPRVWYGQGNYVKYVPWFDITGDPTQVPSGMSYKLTGNLVTPWLGAPEFRATALDFRFLSRGLNADQYLRVYYSLNQIETDWLLLGTIHNNGAVILPFPSGGQQYRTIRVKLELVRDPLNALTTPYVTSAVLRWTPMPRILLGYAFDVDMSQPHGGKQPADLERLLLASADGAVVPFTYRHGVVKYVRIETCRGIGQTGADPRARYTVTCTELTPADDVTAPTMIWGISSTGSLWDGNWSWG